MLNLNRGINDVIKEYPIVEKFLSENDINCSECSLGSCLLKDIFEIHNFSKEDQKEMLEYMNDLVKDNSIEIKKFIPQKNKNDYNKLIKMLIEEHKLILELVYTADFLCKKDGFLKTNYADYKQIIRFFKEYADTFHHSKEEDLLFGFFQDNEIIKTMLNEHFSSRDYYKKLVASQDENEIRVLIGEYKDLLSDHIYKEDYILFPYLDRLLTKEMIEKINQEINKYNVTLNQIVSTFLKDFNNKAFNY